jgi:shikimate kinase
MTPLVLVGLMGAGKSTVGAAVAERTGRSLVDTDVVIHARTGRSVRPLWDELGEASCRRMESDVVFEALRDVQPTVIAAPGGLVLDPAARRMLSTALVVWLRADAPTLAARVRPGDHRPLLGDDPGPVLAAMHAERDPLYAEVADAVIDVDGQSADAVATQVVALLDGAGRDR